MLIDAFMFNGELDILDLRLHELASIVDYFVIVESMEMHGSDKKKDLVFDNNRHLFEEFEDQIIYVGLKTLIPPFGDPNGWARENYQRNQVMRGIRLVATATDTIMLSDVDEIPRASVIPGFIGGLLFGTVQDFFYYNVNNYIGEWHGTVIGTLQNFLDLGTFQDARNMRDGLPRIENCGWHFSYFGGLERIRYKAENFVHAGEQICTDLKTRSDEEVLRDIAEGRDLFHRPGPPMEKRSSDDPRLPKYFLENKHRFPLWTT